MKKNLVIPVRIINNKIEMNLNEMKKDVFYPIKYKNKIYLIGSEKEGIIDIYKIKK